MQVELEEERVVQRWSAHSRLILGWLDLLELLELVVDSVDVELELWVRPSCQRWPN